MTKQKPKKTKLHSAGAITKDSPKKVDITVVKAASNAPFQDVTCRTEHGKLFEELLDWSSPPPKKSRS